MQHVLLLTGRPGTGKTSLIKQVASSLKGRACGFYTEEIRHDGQRLGFRLITLDGVEAVLSHVDIHSPHRVSRYGVDVAALEAVGVSALEQAVSGCDLVVVDEIGKMELFSPRFKEAVMRAIGSGKKVLGTIMLNSNQFADDIKRRPEVKLITVTRDNHVLVLEAIGEWLE